MRDIVIKTAIFDREAKGKKPKVIGLVRELHPDDPRNLHHPSHRERWLELARAIGAAQARADFERLEAEHPPGTVFVIAEESDEDRDAREAFEKEMEARRRY